MSFDELPPEGEDAGGFPEYLVPGLHELVKEIESVAKNWLTRKEFADWMMERDIMWKRHDPRARVPEMWQAERGRRDNGSPIHHDEPPSKRQMLL